MDDFAARFRTASEACDRTVMWRRYTPAQHLARLAEKADELDLAWDSYGERGAVALLESAVADLLGKPAAAMMTGRAWSTGSDSST